MKWPGSLYLRCYPFDNVNKIHNYLEIDILPQCASASPCGMAAPLMSKSTFMVLDLAVLLQQALAHLNEKLLSKESAMDLVIWLH